MFSPPQELSAVSADGCVVGIGQEEILLAAESPTRVCSMPLDPHVAAGQNMWQLKQGWTR